jgi:hypothetical protein
MSPAINLVPSFSDLPIGKDDPPHSAWGLWGDGQDHSLGALNYLTDELVLRAIKEEVKTGERVGLKYVKRPIFFFLTPWFECTMSSIYIG